LSCSAVLLPQCHHEPLLRANGLRKFVFCFLNYVWINSKIYLYVPKLILKYLKTLSSSLSKSSRRFWNSPKLSRLELILCTQKRLFLVNRRFLHQILSINENTCTWFGILALQKCQLHCFQFGSARPAMWIVTRSARFSSVLSGSAQLGSACSDRHSGLHAERLLTPLSSRDVRKHYCMCQYRSQSHQRTGYLYRI